ncbi:MAG: hypothetical protein HY897_09365 [Deltaproteobacteria bacterium]|nr:hypothetical protein [Deltaproteobacteria bacterium]
MNEGVFCDDGDPATTEDHCDGKGNCVTGPWDVGVDGGFDGAGDDVAEAGFDGEAGGGEAELDGGAEMEDAATGDADAEAVHDAALTPDAQTDAGARAADSGQEVIIEPAGCGCAQVGT